MADHACQGDRDTLTKPYRLAHGLGNDLAAIHMYSEFVVETASRNRVDPPVSSIPSDLEQVRLATEYAPIRARLLTRCLPEALDDEETPP